MYTMREDSECIVNICYVRKLLRDKTYILIRKYVVSVHPQQTMEFGRLSSLHIYQVNPSGRNPTMRI